MLAGNGAFVVRTGQFTGRSPKDKYIVRDAGTEATVDWGAVNQPRTPEGFEGLHARLIKFLSAQAELFVLDGATGLAHPFRPPAFPALF